jgi:hypothetical protein
MPSCPCSRLAKEWISAQNVFMIMLEDYSLLRQNFNSSILELPQGDIVKSSLLK